MKRRPGGLGRGLDALLPARAAGGVLELDVAAVRPNPAQPRTRIPPDELAELAASIAEHGVLQPIIVTGGGEGYLLIAGERGFPQPIIVTGGGEGYLLIAGERRWRAAQLAGRRTIPAVVKEATDQERLELALVENLQRQDLTPLEEAAAYRQLVAEH